MKYIFVPFEDESAYTEELGLLFPVTRDFLKTLLDAIEASRDMEGILGVGTGVRVPVDLPLARLTVGQLIDLGNFSSPTIVDIPDDEDGYYIVWDGETEVEARWGSVRGFYTYDPWTFIETVRLSEEYIRKVLNSL